MNRIFCLSKSLFIKEIFFVFIQENKKHKIYFFLKTKNNLEKKNESENKW